MYKVVVDSDMKKLSENFDFYFIAKTRAEFLYTQGFNVKVLKGDKVIHELLHNIP